MRTYNQQIEDAYAASKRQGDSMRNREIERSSGQDRRNRYRDDTYRYSVEHGPIDEPYQLQNDRTDRYGYERNTFYNDPDLLPDGYWEYRDGQDAGNYPETYRSAAGGYMSEHVGRDRERRDYTSGFDREGNLYGSHYGLHRGKGPKNYRRSDDRIREDINDRITDDPHVDASEIEITVQNGEITLMGTVGDRSQKRRAEDLAESVSGVGNVENRIKVRSRSSEDERAEV